MDQVKDEAGMPFTPRERAQIRRRLTDRHDSRQRVTYLVIVAVLVVYGWYLQARSASVTQLCQTVNVQDAAIVSLAQQRFDARPKTPEAGASASEAAAFRTDLQLARAALARTITAFQPHDC